MPSQSRRRSRTGQYGKLSAYEPARPSRKRMRSPKRRRASTTRRDLPMPDSPVIETIAPLPSAIASQAPSSTASSALAADQRHDRAHLRRPACARHAGDAQRPLDARAARPRRATRARSTAAPGAPSPGRRRCRRRRASCLQAGGDVGGVAEGVVASAVVLVGQHDRYRVERDAHRQLDAVAAAQLLAVGGDRRWIASAARTARSASSSCPTGAPNSANSPSPSSCATVPSKRRTSARDQRDDLVEQELGALRARAARRSRSSRRRPRRGP